VVVGAAWVVVAGGGGCCVADVGLDPPAGPGTVTGLFTVGLLGGPAPPTVTPTLIGLGIGTTTDAGAGAV